MKAKPIIMISLNKSGHTVKINQHIHYKNEIDKNEIERWNIFLNSILNAHKEINEIQIHFNVDNKFPFYFVKKQNDNEMLFYVGNKFGAIYYTIEEDDDCERKYVFNEEIYKKTYYNDKNYFDSEMNKCEMKDLCI